MTQIRVEHPQMKSLILRPHEVRNALDHGCGQIRRVVKHSKGGVLPADFTHFEHRNGWSFYTASPERWPEEYRNLPGVQSPFGTPGDLVFVKEECSWIDTEAIDCVGCLRAFHMDGVIVFEDGRPNGKCTTTSSKNWTDSLRAEMYDLNSSFGHCSPKLMPRWASRLTLEITAVRVERVQEMTINDAVACGWNPDYSTNGLDMRESTIKRDFLAFCKSIFKPGNDWGSNPFVWVGEYKVINNEGDTT